jgi:hypothetical protein
VDEPAHVAARDAERLKAGTAAASLRGCEGTLVTTTLPVASSTAVRSVNVPPTSIPTMNMAADRSRS